MYPSAYLSPAYPSILIHPVNHLSMHPTISFLSYTSINPPTTLFLSIHPAGHQCIHECIHQCIHLSAHSSVHPSISSLYMLKPQPNKYWTQSFTVDSRARPFYTMRTNTSDFFCKAFSDAGGVSGYLGNSDQSTFFFKSLKSNPHRQTSYLNSNCNSSTEQKQWPVV